MVVDPGLETKANAQAVQEAKKYLKTINGNMAPKMMVAHNANCQVPTAEP